MFQITPVGSCRITNPLRVGQETWGFQVNMGRSYGYCHTPAEAVQMARFLQGDIDIPAELWPLIGRGQDRDTVMAASHAPSDLYVVELASAKEVTIDGVSVQLNYLNAAYQAFFSQPDRAKAFWEVVQSGNEATCKQFLLDHWSGGTSQRDDADVLRRIKLSLVSRKSLRRDLDRLQALLPEVLFVSHVNACKPDGRPIPSRSDFIAMVAAGVRDAGGRFFDPTELMEEFGQATAIADESTGLAHFTDAFAEGLVDRWMTQVIAPQTDRLVTQRGGEAGSQLLHPQIQATINSGHFFAADRRIAALSAQVPGLSELHQQLGQFHTKAKAQFIGDVVKTTEHGLDADQGRRIVVAACRLGLFDSAIELAGLMPGGAETLPTHILLNLADQATDADHVACASQAYAAAFRGHASPAADRLANLAIAQNQDVLQLFNKSEAARFLAQLAPVSRLQLTLLNGAADSDAITAQTPAAEIADMVAYLKETQNICRAAELLAQWRCANGAERVTDKRLRAMLDEWVQSATDGSAPLDQTQELNAVLHAAPHHAGARNAMRQVRRNLVDRMKSAAAAGDIETLDTMTDESAALAAPVPELDLWRARLRFKAGDYEVALRLGRKAAAALPNNINVWVLLMRAASRTGDAVNAADHAQRVLALAGPDHAKLKAEAGALIIPDRLAV